MGILDSIRLLFRNPPQERTCENEIESEKKTSPKTDEKLDMLSPEFEGGIRNTKQFWKQWITIRPDSLSDSNHYMIENMGRSPIIDKKWIGVFPEHADYIGEVLIHHHVNEGSYAIPVPKSTHPGSGGVWHGFFPEQQ